MLGGNSMQIQAIHIDHLLSFNKFVWEELDPRLNVIVGPNGVGKTNLFHALRVVRDVLSPARSQDAERWVGAGHQGSDVDTITIKLDIQFTTTWEKHLLCVFFASMLSDQQEIQQLATTMQRGPDPDGVKRFDNWVLERIRPKDLSWFLHGQLVITHAGRSGWQCRYEARPQKPMFRLNLTNLETLLGHAKHNPEAATDTRGSLFVAWCNSLTEQERERLKNGLTKATPEGEFPVPDHSHLPDWVSSQQGIVLRIEDRFQITDVDPTTLATHRALTSATGISLEQGKPLGMRTVFQLLLEQALVFTDNVRLVPQSLFVANRLFAQPLDLSNGEQLARFLFCKKNGNRRDRGQYDEIGKLFTRMTGGREFNVVLSPANSERSQPRLSVSQQPERFPSDQQPDISLELVTNRSWGDIPLEVSGAGIAEALFLSAVLAGSTGQVVLLDEPALNLHPTMQTILLNALQALVQQPAGEKSQFLVNTHTPALVPSDAIECVSRFTLGNGQTIRQALKVGRGDHVGAGQISQNDLVKIRQLLRGNPAARALLFGRAVLLIEGSTELAALPVWCADLVYQDIALYPVDGRGGFVSPLRLLHHFAIPWAIIGDSEVLWDLKEQKQSGSPLNHISDILTVCGQPLPSIQGDPGKSDRDFAEFRQTMETYGIFTLASNAREGFEKAIRPEVPPDIWAEAEKKFGKNNKVALSRFVAENSPCPGKVAGLIRKVLRHLQKQDASILVPDDDHSRSSITNPGS